MLHDIHIFANFGRLDETPKSGGQTSARRVMKGLESLGYEMHPIVKHRSEWKGRLAHKVEVMLFAIGDVLKIFGRLLFKRRKGATFMMLTYAGSLVPFEFIITLVVRMLGFKSTYYLKGGKLLDTYPEGSKLHKWLFRKTINRQSLVMFEGEDSMNIVKEFATVSLVYFPNYIMDEQMRTYAEKAAEPVGILYFGRVTPEKNAHVILEAFDILAEKYPDMRLTVIGDSTRAINYTENIAKKIATSPYHDRITKLGNSPFEVLAEAMQKSHFFIFPSHEQAEGHSNSLTEAMSRGLVPIVSDWHFNRTIVGDEQLVVKGFNPEDYAARIDEVIQAGNWSELSQKMYDRVCTRFRERVVLDNINEELKKISV